MMMIKRLSGICKYARHWFMKRQFHIADNNAKFISNSLIILIALYLMRTLAIVGDCRG